MLPHNTDMCISHCNSIALYPLQIHQGIAHSTSGKPLREVSELKTDAVMILVRRVKEQWAHILCQEGMVVACV
jgi:hypothetical protein